MRRNHIENQRTVEIIRWTNNVIDHYRNKSAAFCYHHRELMSEPSEKLHYNRK